MGWDRRVDKLYCCSVAVLSLQPVFSPSNVDENWDGQGYGLAHEPTNPFGVLGGLGTGEFEDQLVMNLQEEFYLGRVFLDVLVDIYHGYFHQVGGRALYDGIDGGSLC